MSPLPLAYLRFFVQASASGSFTAAASELGVTPAAVSRSVNLLEKHLGVRLIQRNTRRMRLTPEGREYLDRVRQALAVVDEAGAIVKDHREGISGNVRLSSVSFFGKHVLLPLLARFRERYPEVNFEIAFDDGDANLVDGGFDLAIRRTPATDENVVSRRLSYLPLAIVAHPDYLRRRGIPRTPREIDEHDGIVVRLPSGLNDVWHLAPESGPHVHAAAIDVRPKVALIVTEQLDAVMNATLQGLGLACMSISPTMPQLRSGDLKLLLAGWRVISAEQEYVGVFLHYMQRRYQPRRLRLLIDFLVEHFRASEIDVLDPAFYAG
jgi:DNA-binding transcriptional LysR family regulator